MNIQKVWGMSLKVCTVNIEGDRHLHRWPAVIKAEQPDVVCLQEVFEADMEYIELELGMSGSFFPMMDINQVNKYHISPRGKWGIALLTNLQVTSPSISESHLAAVPVLYNGGVSGFYYAKSPKVLPFVLPNDASRVFAVGTVLKDGQEYTVGTTHFTWSGKGETTDEQREDLQTFLNVLQQFPELVFCGDFNAPRGKEIFSELEKYYTDNLPKEIQTTIDLELHYAAPLYLVVDTIFSTPQYQLTNVRTLQSVSDHNGVVGEVQRV